MTDMDKKAIAAQALSLMDLTSLNDDDNDPVIEKLCSNASSEHGNVAAVCLYPQFIKTAKKQLGQTDVKVATVTNFPDGSADISRAESETRDAVALGADEVDVVFPWRALKAGDVEIGQQLVERCKAACGDQAILKVIIESGELAEPDLIKQASTIAIQAGANFIKTSTGKVPVNATLEAAEIMLNCIKELNPACGFKAAGGVRSTEQAADYIELANGIMGADWVTQAHFRFGASGLLASLQATLGGETVGGEKVERQSQY